MKGINRALPFTVWYEAEYRAAFKDPTDALIFVAALGQDTLVRLGHGRILWREGAERIEAHESYDLGAEIIRAKLDEWGIHL